MRQLTRRQFVRGMAGGIAGGAIMRPPFTWGQQPSEQFAPDSPVASVRYLGNQFLENPIDITGTDGATSFVLPSGDALWLFGDTVEGPFETIRGLELTKLRSNVAAIVPPQDASQGIKKFEFLTTPDGKRPRQLVPFAPDEDPALHRVWAVHGVSIGDKVYLYYHRISLLKDVDVFMNFQLDGMGLAHADPKKLEFTRLTAPDGTREFWKGDQPSFGVFVERLGDYLYVWGSLMTGMYLARVKPEAIEDLNAYEYLAAPSTEDSAADTAQWSNTFEPAAALFDSVPNEMSAAYNPYLKKHVAFHSHLRENKIVMRTAPRITGPWSESQVIYRPARVKDDDLIYAGKEHPELRRDGGRVMYVTFVNSSTYVPQMIEVTLK